MMRSLRFRLPALFLAGIVAAGIVSAAIAFQLLQNYSRSQSVKELRREANGLSALLAKQAVQTFQQNQAPLIAPKELESASGDLIYYSGVPLFPGQQTGLRVLPKSARQQINSLRIRAGHTQTLDFTPPGKQFPGGHPLVAVAGPLTVNGRTFGVLVIAKQQTELTETWVTLMKFFGVSILGGLLVAGLLGWYASRRITKPVLGLTKAADQIALGRYDVPVPEVKGGGEISDLADRFRDMAARLGEAEERERNFLMTVSHELRTPLTAIRGHVTAMQEGLTTDPDDERASLDVIADATARLERLVGDVLDLAKLDAHRFTVLHEEVDMARLLGEAEERERNFLMTVSHELRTPLTAIRGHVTAMQEGLTTDPDDERASLDVIADATARLERLVGDVLDLAKLDAHRFTVLHEEVDMARLLDEAYATFGEEARRRSIDYRCDIEAHPVIVTDGDRVLQIISNLLTNAFRWTPDGGRVDLGLTQSNGAVSVVVGDNGPGIRPEERERIFRPFFSRDKAGDGSGTGLGLAIARELAQALGGRIEVDTKPGEGSRFKLSLPATPAL
ncbi:MAG TPA: histidine kinase dimerization/phospho-acceptor domain-containing protein [Gaiellaceae bacterium]|nr:histidine kinase dimerization/phospho-acceptor domain-containing protein [Gaiellaceae bacterium]